MFAAPLGAQTPVLLGVGLPQPADLDLRTVEAGALLPRDNRDAAQVESARGHWTPLLTPLRGATSVRIRLPRSGPRVPLLLAAAQALKAQNPGQLLFVAF